MPIDYSKYNPLWKEKIRPEILKRDNYKCVKCSAQHKSKGYRDQNNIFHECDQFQIDWAKRNNIKIIRIILTVAHLDHDRTHDEYSNLASLCQRCHLNHDRADNILKRKSKVLFTGVNPKN
jgi:5-methylcytosine-specific restriction endonuclease McrA